MSHLTFEPCPDCGNADPSDFTIYGNGDALDENDMKAIFASYDGHVSAIQVICDDCDYSSARSVTVK